ncbi:MAG: DUF917 domain-containing protein [Actinobacteria bacterium]|nr:DUF917 domain-containing protein [Actinomycetota bacterium]
MSDENRREHGDTAPLTLIDTAAVHTLSLGCAVLGAGGGGSIRNGLLAAQQAIQASGPVRVVQLSDLPDDALIMPCASLGAPLVADEIVGDGNEGSRLARLVREHTGRAPDALMPSEIGGINGLLPVVWAAQTGLPLVDADGMGRAFSRMVQVTMELAGVPVSPCIITDHRGHSSVLRHDENEWVERAALAIASASGGLVSTTEYLMTAAAARKATILGSITRAFLIGKALAQSDPVETLLRSTSAKRLITGTVAEIRWQSEPRAGAATIDGVGADRGRSVRIELQDDILIATEHGRVLAAVPDVIAALGTVTTRPITAEQLRLGQQLSLLALSADPIWFSEAGLRLVGPKAYGYDLAHPHSLATTVAVTPPTTGPRAAVAGLISPPRRSKA